jgi:hypothetical protein
VLGIGASSVPGSGSLVMRVDKNELSGGLAQTNSAADVLPPGGARARSSRPHTFHNISVS